ncbi:thioesterase family protein [Pseudoalteromonas luteoviolacea]|uniref:acyl-CoA thioesterase n=1 Tax=Pseudoalteromonas luteoviolacea TaxID=43657 RepID=UPI001B37990C|nr:thioesterase family protein [Pseudoalteromonas luteoviolacea]MBQ4810712.1 thioesterase family protein [Pseudoalteromonas luteoviolacea]
MDFQTLISSSQLHEAHPLITVPDTWSQGRTVFGGLSAALMLKHMYLQINDESRRLLSFNCNFVAPLLAETPFTISTKILRSGKNVTQVETIIEQNELTCLVSLACFGVERQSSVNVPAHETPAKLNQSINPKQTLQYIEGLFPAFIQNIDLNLQHGAMPFSGATTTEIHGWMKFKGEEKGNLNELHVLALADAWPPTLLQLCNSPSPASTVSWYIEFLQPLASNDSQWLGYQVATHQASGGYGTEDAKIFSQTGELIALSRQTVAVFDS